MIIPTFPYIRKNIHIAFLPFFVERSEGQSSPLEKKLIRRISPEE
jgi:hypothetical protein